MNGLVRGKDHTETQRLLEDQTAHYSFHIRKQTMQIPLLLIDNNQIVFKHVKSVLLD